MGALTSFSLSAVAGGFQLHEENVTNLGNAYAGTGAEADDASTEFFNPAGMTRLDTPQFVISGTYINLNVDSHINSATSTFSTGPIVTNTFLGTLSPFTPPPGAVTTGPTEVRPGTYANIPAFHFVYPICHKWAVGFGVTAPFGLETNYPDDSLARFLATDSAIEVINLGPSIAYQLTNAFSLGAGLDSQYMSATFDQDIPSLSGNFPDGTFTNEGDSWGLGWHAGALFQFSPETRVGFTYHSQVHHEIKGLAIAKVNVIFPTINGIPIIGSLTPPPLNIDTSGNFTANATLPAYADLGVYHDFNEQWAGMADVEYTDWSTIQDIVANYQGTIGDIIPNATLPFDFRNTYRVAAGINYKPAQKWTLRTGVAFDESPVKNDETRTFRLPDSNRYWVALGGQYIINDEFKIDVGYAHLFVTNSSINNNFFINSAPQTVTIPFIASLTTSLHFAENATGNFRSSVDEVGAQLTWTIL